MKSFSYLYLLFAFLIITQGVSAQNVKMTPIQPMTASIKLPELREELLKRVKADQEARMALSQKDNPSAVEEMKKIDKENTVWIKQKMSEHGWLGASKVGLDGSQAAFLLVQHAAQDAEFQKQALELLEKAVKDGEALPVYLAFLTDRVRLAQGKPQVYGTQTRVTKEGKFEVPPIEDEANVDKRRAEVGLEPLESYHKKMRERYQKSPN